MKKLKIAIVHDYIKEYGGAERVVEAMLEIWPEADIFTTIYSPEFLGPHRTRVEKWNIHTSSLDKVPFKNKLISAFRLLGPWIFKTFDLSKYDVVIVSQSGTFVSPNMINKNINYTQITYCHTPPRWLYGYQTAGNWEGGLKKLFKDIFGTIPIWILRKIDFTAAQIPDFYIANSKEIASRIKRFYHRDAVVIHPPVEVPKVANLFHLPGGRRGNYYLAGGRLARPKGIDLAVMACTKLDLPLKVFGKEFAGYGKELEKLAGPTVEFLGEVSEKDKWELYKNAKAYLYPNENEDFGIQAVEAMAAGTPVIALAQGGPLETIIDGKTGVFFKERTIESLMNAVKHFNDLDQYTIKAGDCIKQAKKFSKERFKKEMLQFVESHAQNKK